jgi:hypothetical protein
VAKAKDAEVKKSGAGKLTREQMLAFLRKKEEEADTTPYVVKALFGDDLSIVTETHARMIIPKVRMRLLLAAADPTRIKPLVQVFLEEYNKEMVNFERKGRLELLGALQALAMGGEEEQAVSMSK